MTFRKILFWSHLVTGIAAGLVILLLSVTGLLLTYEVQMIHWAENRFGVEGAGAGPLSADALAEIAVLETGGAVTELVFENDPSASVLASSGRDGKIFLDPYSGEVLSDTPTAIEGFFGSVTHLHRWLSFSGPSKTGGAITGAANLLFGFLLLSGAYLWLPKLWRWGMLKMRILFRRSYPNAKARDFAWHHVFACWAAIPLFFIIFSGVVISYSWASDLVQAAFGEAVHTEEDGAQGHGPGKGMGAGMGRGRGRSGGDDHATGSLAIAEEGVGLQAVLDTAAAHDPAWNRITLTLPRGDAAEMVSAKLDTGTGKQAARQETLAISQETGEVTGVSSLADRSAAMRARIWLRFVHTGEVYGIIGQTIAGLASLAGIFMVYTGLALSYRRLIRPLFRRAKSTV
ncbi:PepSY-associated TM helix domain-containing protein [Tropicimonas sp. TH_r6]|uniref:PepSY-associated TM helix domain-containing protein n=1 Tax=Tropicimonas sp. TH_r6 TaxID=3082085 RepID=UPI00295349D2|nr:PepSY-associated TM helix domain-containing protein [Tropicimonas sp. TH_r6]MDV7145218.1 PepSY-associated TM helix domain-containing protein [Tropicimonas sp. TH_r6]